MREAWTDERLDDMSLRMENGFKRVDVEFHEMRREMNSRFDSMQRLILQVGAGMLATMVIGFVSVVVALG